ncbi:flavin reductase family protein [Pseudomaricurvus alkylphenolicus]|uniref:flavin reductase family protein n=1 Tax=Pseudomaricurvus alkylphenolicus TaxID=1306991 RepID=UPI001421BADD|nr:flavin reductase family protein [Pseudomaricurvus alkylphenolicus]NIB44701.1 flavin reductase family protein [Pseudomaricurvus alkylphenolicus]
MCQLIDNHLDTSQLRQTLGQWATGVAVVTTATPRGPVGMTINSFQSISLHPPLISWCIDLKASSYGDFQRCSHFSLSILNRRQERIATRFAKRGADKFSILNERCYTDCNDSSETNNDPEPLVEDCSAWLRCRLYRQILLGDHLMLIGEVISFSVGTESPLLFYQGQMTSTPESIA